MKTIKESYEDITISSQRKEVILHNLLNQQTIEKSSFVNTKLILSFITICIIAILTIPHKSIQQESQIPLISQKGTNNAVCTLDKIPYNMSTLELADLNFYVYANVMVYNQEIMDSFIKDIHNKQTSHIRIAIVTEEGDSILTEVYSHPNDGVIIYKDTTRYKFGPSSLTQYHYQKIGTYDHALYAYNDELNQQTIDNSDVYFIAYSQLNS